MFAASQFSGALPHAPFQRGMRLPQSFLGLLALGDVLADDDQIEPTADANPTAPGLDLDHAAILSPRQIIAGG